MDFSAGNVIFLIAIIVAAGVMIWQFILANPPESNSEDDTWYDDVDATEASIDETEEYMARMERLSKRTIQEEDDKKK